HSNYKIGDPVWHFCTSAPPKTRFPRALLHGQVVVPQRVVWASRRRHLWAASCDGDRLPEVCPAAGHPLRFLNGTSEAGPAGGGEQGALAPAVGLRHLPAAEPA